MSVQGRFFRSIYRRYDWQLPPICPYQQFNYRKPFEEEHSLDFSRLHA